ncbi:predicted protein, partial [Nematostella vectensis]
FSPISLSQYLSKKLGADPMVFGYLQTTFAVVQLCGGPVYGRFGDLFGSKAALGLAFSASALSYGLLSVSTSVPMLFFSRLPSVFMHVMQGSQMIITDISSKEDRAGALGKLGVSYAVGMVVGPFLGGIMTKHYGGQFAAMCSCVLSLISVAMVMVFLPTKTKHLFHAPASSTSVFDVKKFLELLRIPAVLYLICIKLVSAVPFGIFQSMFAIVSMEYFKLDAQYNGFVLSYAGTLSIVVQGIGVGYLSHRFNDTDLLKWSIGTIAFAYACMFMVTTIYQFCAVLIPLVAGGTILTIVTTSSMTKAVPIKDTGTVLGLSMACNSLVRSVSPTLGGVLFHMYGWPVFGAFGFVINSAIGLFLLVWGRESLH